MFFQVFVTQDIEKGKEQVKEAGVFLGQQIEIVDKNSRYGDMPADNAAAGLAAAEDLGKWSFPFCPAIWAGPTS